MSATRDTGKDPDGKGDRAELLASALRENLKRRKARQRGATSSTDESGKA